MTCGALYRVPMQRARPTSLNDLGSDLRIGLPPPWANTRSAEHRRSHEVTNNSRMWSFSTGIGTDPFRRPHRVFHTAQITRVTTPPGYRDIALQKTAEPALAATWNRTHVSDPHAAVCTGALVNCATPSRHLSSYLSKLIIQRIGLRRYNIYFGARASIDIEQAPLRVFSLRSRKQLHRCSAY